MNYYYSYDMDKQILFNEFNKKINDKELFNKSFGAWVENRMNEIMFDCNSGNVAQTRQIIERKYKADKSNGLLKGERSLSTFKRDNPLIIHNKNYKISQGNNGYEIDLSLFSRQYQKNNNIKILHFNIDKIDNSKKTILNNIISGNYKQGMVQLQQNRKGKWEVIISFGFESEKKDLDYNRILGIDLGITNVATMQIYDKNIEQYDWLSYKECMIDGKELIHFRQKIEARKRQLSIASKWCGDGRIGHGRNTRMKPIYDIGDKINRFKDTYNHKVSKYIIDLAMKKNCGTIQMEDLSGFTEGQSESFLKNWSYYDLQQKIQYKAEEVGITIIFILPNYTSLRCNNCGFIDYENRNCKQNQAKFQCVVCDNGKINEKGKGKVNADINAARNIALPNIENIILEQLKIQSVKSDTYMKMYNTYNKLIINKKSKNKIA
jgi:IS605 OrfB family transposase